MKIVDKDATSSWEALQWDVTVYGEISEGKVEDNVSQYIINSLVSTQ